MESRPQKARVTNKDSRVYNRIIDVYQLGDSREWESTTGLIFKAEDLLFLKKDPIDWRDFRRFVAKDVLCAIIQSDGASDCRTQIEKAIEYTDLLISALNSDDTDGLVPLDTTLNL